MGRCISKNLRPMVNLRPHNVAVFNRVATEILTQDGDRFFAVIRHGNHVQFRPLTINGLVTIARLNQLDSRRVFAATGIEPSGPVVCEAKWNDNDGSLEIDLGAARPVRSMRKTSGRSDFGGAA